MAISPNRSDLENRISREMESTKIGEETPCLPEQLIVEEILPRLPFKSLLKFRCVSKSWCSLIAKTHRCIFFDYSVVKFKQCSLPSMFDKPFTAPISHISDLGIDKSNMHVPVGCCCNGLVCILVSWKRFILWNPTTKKFRNLPNLYNQLKVKCGRIMKYGFGFDESSDDYKVFGVVHVKGPRVPPHCIGMIYSLRSNLWKPIEKTDLSPIDDGFMGGIGMHVGGKLHWKSLKGEIFSFCLNRHVSAVVELPSYTNGVFHSVGVIGGCLSANFVHPNGGLDVWLNKEYGVKESWVKVVTLPYYGPLKNPVPKYDDLKYPVLAYDDLKILFPVAIAPNGEVLLIRHSIIVIYNPKCNVFRRAFDFGLASVVWYLGIYVESFASVALDAQ